MPRLSPNPLQSAVFLLLCPMLVLASEPAEPPQVPEVRDGLEYFAPDRRGFQAEYEDLIVVAAPPSKQPSTCSA